MIWSSHRLQPCRVPLTLVGGAESGEFNGRRSGATALAVPDGVLITCRGRVSLWTQDCSRPIWSEPIEEWATPRRVTDDEVVLAWPGIAQRRRLSNGAIVDEQQGVRRLLSVWPAGYASTTQAVLRVAEWSGRVLWQRELDAASAVVSGRYLLIGELFPRKLFCFDVHDGTLEWTFEIPAGREHRDNELATGEPCVTVVGDRVLAVTHDRRLFALALETGELLAWTRPEFVGWFQVTDEVIYFLQPFGYSVFDHGTMQERHRMEYEAEVRPLYGARPISFNGACITQDAVIWTTMHETLMGISRLPDLDGRRRTWTYQTPGINPLARAPVVAGDYLYHPTFGERPGMLCFRGATLAS
jgi:outer membrane protein assembly factor BamB